MMSEIFLVILNLSITASFVAVIVMLLRLLLGKAPRYISCLLWALVALRLVCPFAVESELSLLPNVDTSSASSSVSDSFYADGEVAIGSSGGNSAVANINTNDTNNAEPDIVNILSIVWVSGMSAVLLYGVGSYVLLRIRVSDSIPLQKNIRCSEKVDSPFILGIVKPKIYLPFGIDKKTKKHVLAHEQAHLKRLDHLTKPFGFLLLAVHWFNPFMWLSYILLCRDIEVACDEKVIRDMSLKSRKAYATALLDCKVKRRALAACPVAFGEVGVGERIKKTLSYKKPAAWVITLAMVCCLVATVCLLTDPVSAAEDVELPNTQSHRVTEGYTEPVPTETTAVTEPPTSAPAEPPTEATEPPTEAPADPYEEGYSEDYYEEGYSEEEYYDDSYSEDTDEEAFYEELRNIEPLKIEVTTMEPIGGGVSLLDGMSSSKVSSNGNFPVVVWDVSGYSNPE